MITWMLYAAAIGGLVAAAAAAGAHALRAGGRSTRGVWAAALALSIGVPVTAGGVAAAAPGPPAVTVSLAPAHSVPASADGPAVAASSEAAPATGRWSRIQPALPAVWAAGSLALLAGLVASTLMLARQRRRWRPARVAGASVFLSERLGPAVAGVLRPRIVLPAWVLDRPEAEQRLIVAHEQEHVRARDPLLLAAGWLTTALMPWSPALWWQLRRLRLAVELDCDARVLRAGHDVGAYGGLLLTVGEIHLSSLGAAAALAEPRSFLARRIRAMTTHSTHRRSGILLALGTATLLVAATAAIPAPALELPRLVGQASDTLPVYDVAEVDRVPRFANAPEVRQALEAAYPAELRARGVTGFVNVEVIVETDGAARLVRVLTAEPAGFTDAARGVVPRFRFEPAALNGRAVRTRLVIPIAFELSRAIAPGETAPLAAARTLAHPAGEVAVTLAPAPAAGSHAATAVAPAPEAEIRAYREAVAAAGGSRAYTTTVGAAPAARAGRGGTYTASAAARAEAERAGAYAASVAPAPAARGRGGVAVAAAPYAASVRAAEVSAVRAARSQAAASRSAREAEVAAAAAATAAGSAHDGLEEARAELRQRHPELMRGSREAVTVFFVRGPDGAVRRSVVVPGSRMGAAGNRSREGALWENHSTGGRSASAEARGVPGVDPEQVDAISVYRSRSLPEGVTVGWITLKP